MAEYPTIVVVAFLAQLAVLPGEKGQFIVAALSTRYHPLGVVAAAGVAFAGWTALEIWLGSALQAALPPLALDAFTGGLFLLFAVLLTRSAPNPGQDVAAATDGGIEAIEGVRVPVVEWEVPDALGGHQREDGQIAAEGVGHLPLDDGDADAPDGLDAAVGRGRDVLSRVRRRPCQEHRKQQEQSRGERVEGQRRQHRLERSPQPYLQCRPAGEGRPGGRDDPQRVVPRRQRGDDELDLLARQYRKLGEERDDDDGQVLRHVSTDLPRACRGVDAGRVRLPRCRATDRRDVPSHYEGLDGANPKSSSI